ncbi:MAG: hypothetical protein ACYDBB_00905 [Armatimonadota bacterium]
MDTSSVASMITQVLRTYLTNSSQLSSLAGGQQGGMVEKARGLFDLVKNKLGGQPESARTLQAFEQAPDQHAGEMQNTLTQHLSSDPGFMSQATDYLQQIQPGAAGGSMTEKAGGMISGLFGGKKEEEPGEEAA